MRSWLARAVDLFRKPKPTAVVSATNEIETVSQFVANRPVGPETVDIRKLVDQGYRRNVIAYVCVNEIASSAAAPRVYLRDRKSQEEIEEHELLELLARPAPGLSWYELMERLLIYQQTSGTGYIHKGRAGAGQLVQLKAARPDRLQPVPDRQGNVLYYEYKIEGMTAQRVETEDLAAFPLPDPLNDFHGLAPLSVAAIFGDIDTSAAIYLRDFFANGAMPMGLLKFKIPNVRREDRLRVQGEWAETYGGAGNPDIDAAKMGRWHNVGVIGGDVEYQPLGAEPSQLRLDAVWGMTESRLCATFGVPPQLVQARIGLQYATYSNMREARRSFWTETLVPIYRRIEDGLTRNIVAEYDENLELCFDLESIPELQEDLNQRAERAGKLFLGGVASFNEARVLSDLEEAPKDFYAFPGNVTMVPREDVESGKYFKDAAANKKAAQDALQKNAPPKPDDDEPLPFGKPKPDDDQQSEDDSTYETLGAEVGPYDSEREILRATTSLEQSFDEARDAAISASDLGALVEALDRGDWRAAEKAVATERFVQHFSEAIRAQLRRESGVAQMMHYKHHAGGARRETHDGRWVTIKGRPVFIGEKKDQAPNPLDQPGHGGTATTAVYGAHHNARVIKNGPDLDAKYSKKLGEWGEDGSFEFDYSNDRYKQWREHFSSGDAEDAPVPFAVHQPNEGDWWVGTKGLAAGEGLSVETRAVKLSDLVATQYAVNTRYVKPQIAALAADKEKTIDVIEKGGKLYIYDGHHRAVAAKAVGLDTIQAKVWKR